jgi:hypothetical protein
MNCGERRSVDDTHRCHPIFDDLDLDDLLSEPEPG